MVYFVRTGKFVLGTEQEAMEWLRKLARYHNENFPQFPVELLSNFGGPQNEIRWVAKYESVGAFEEHSKIWWSDEGIKSVVAEAKGKTYLTDVVDAFYGIEEL